MRAFHATIILSATVFAVAGPAIAQDSSQARYSAVLDGSSAVPAVTTEGTGEAELFFDPTSMLLSWTVTYDGLSSPVTGAFVHGPAGPDERAIGILSLIRDLSGGIEGSALLSEAQADQLAAGQWYVDISTVEYPRGEIRGTVVLEDPGSAPPAEEVAAEPEPEPEAMGPETPVAEDEPAAEPPMEEPSQVGVASFTEEQVDRGQSAYREDCAGCHGRTLGGEGESPGLIGNGFRNRWFVGQTAATFFGYISNAMPQQAPGSLAPETYADIMAYILDANGFPTGPTELPADLATLATLPIPERTE